MQLYNLRLPAGLATCPTRCDRGDLSTKPAFPLAVIILGRVNLFIVLFFILVLPIINYISDLSLNQNFILFCVVLWHVLVTVQLSANFTSRWPQFNKFLDSFFSLSAFPCMILFWFVMNKSADQTLCLLAAYRQLF